MTLILDATDARGVTLVTVNNAARRNALGNPGKRELAETIERVSAQPDVRVIVLTGGGKTRVFPPLLWPGIRPWT